jgi:hypothetical protein
MQTLQMQHDNLQPIDGVSDENSSQVPGWEGEMDGGDGERLEME